ncbi:MAG: ABC transporter permease [Planctomycetaceae bacterium]
MTQAFYLAIRSLWWHRGRSLILIASLALTIWLPLTVRLALQQFRDEISQRAGSTPLVLGAVGSRMDLALHALYFEARPPSVITMRDARVVDESQLAAAIPLHIRFRTQSAPGVDGVPIVGTSPEYFEFRQLQPAQGELPALLGECILGSAYAERSGLKPGDTLLSAPENALNLAGNYPLQLQVSGVLSASHSPDDFAVFTDIQTAWVIEGIGHGHQEITKETDPTLLMENDSDRQGVTVNRGVLPYIEITEENRDSFHFHGDPDEFPLTAALAVPASDKSRVLLLGRYADTSGKVQCIQPPQVIAELLEMVFRIEQLVWICSLAAAVVTLLLLGLVLSLSLRLRATEMQTMFRLGCSRLTIVQLQSAELLILLATAGTFAAAGGWLTVLAAGTAIRSLLF